MKKIYLSMAMFALGSAAIAQAPTAQKALFAKAGDINAIATTQSQNKALGVSYLISDFSVPGDWTINNAGEPAPFGWGIDQTNDSWAFSTGINSTSGGNYAELYNGDPTTGSPAPVSSTFTMTTTNSIDVMTLAGTSNVLLQFEQYGALFQDNQEVLVSTDGVNFTTVGNNADDIEPLTQAGGSAYPNPMLRSYDISAAIAGNPTTVWIRFSWSPNVQNIAYGWFVDDVSISTKPDNDIKTTTNDWGSVGLHYYQIPLSQVAPIDFWTNVSNIGTADQTNVMLSVDVNSGANTGTSAAGLTLASGASDSLAVSGLFTPSAVGAYAFTWSVVADLTDDVPTNNALTGETFNVVQNIYARDTDGTPGSAGGADQNGDVAFEAGNLFDIYSDAQVRGIDVVVGSGTAAGTIIYGKIYELDQTGNFVYIEETAEYTTTTADASGSTPITLELFTYPTLITGKTYFVAVGCYADFNYGTSGFSPDQTSFIFYGGAGGTGSQYFTNGTPMVRLNFDQSIGIAETAESGITLGQNMPNPFNGNSTINFELTNNSDVQFEFVDMTGKIIKTMDLGVLTPGSHTITIDANEFASGVYYYSLVSEGSRITSKMVVQK